ncbi:hypothetical protein EJB05_02319 [Eragrostis curvula]|uniref:Uncharacterized protein n=1 Tax=Eragrostis curvula TaxID=38414 RepID=A0A5J9WQ95_9POAL|nr:hypothetical protein EJB05_02319 [Eragrostis curvula]
MKLTRSFDEAIERREYVMCAAGDLKLVHYGKVMDETADIAAAVRLARQLEADILAYRDASARKKDENEILRRINSAEVDDEENKTSSRPADRQSGL